MKTHLSSTVYSNLSVGSNIFEILALTFYSILHKESDIVGVKKWIQLLKKCELMAFLKNSSLRKNASENEPGRWYYLGPTS